MASLVRFRRRIHPVLRHVHFRALSNTSYTLKDQQPTQHQKTQTAKQDKRRRPYLSAKVLQSWREGDDSFYNTVNLSKTTDGFHSYRNLQAAWKSLTSFAGHSRTAIPVTQTPTLIRDDFLLAVGDEQDVFVDSSDAVDEVPTKDVAHALAEYVQYEVEVANEMKSSGKKIKWADIRRFVTSQRASPDRPEKLQSRAKRSDRRRDYQPAFRQTREQEEDEEFDEFDEEDVDEGEGEGFDIDEHDGFYDDIYKGDAKAEEQWKEYVMSLSLPSDVEESIIETSGISDTSDLEKESEKIMDDLNVESSNDETSETFDIGELLTEEQEELLEKLDESLDGSIEQYSSEAMEQDAKVAMEALGIVGSSAGDANATVLEQSDNQMSEEGQDVKDVLTIDSTSEVKRHEDFATIVPQHAPEDKKMEIFTKTIEKAEDMLNRDQAREFLPKDFPSPLRVPFEDIVKSGNYVERPVIDDRDLTPTEIYGDYSRWTELQSKSYGPSLTKNSSISPADKEKMSAIIDRFMSQQ
ncbi:hypothetical protein V1509DRAFT_564501 [Lipomyces kononenkoae]